MGTFKGTNGDDALYGGSDPDTISGLGGNDSLKGFAGADSLDGGGGIDTAFYGDSTIGVGVNLATGRGFGGSAEGDTLTGIENLYGSDQNDALTGDTGANELHGQGGLDVLSGGGGADRLDGGAGDDILKGGGGADFLDGGAGIDTVDYSQAAPSGIGTVGVKVYLKGLSDGTYGDFGEAEGDVLVNIENLTGSAYDDRLDGNDGVDNRLIGLDGNDNLGGFGGNDWLDGGRGNDVFDSGPGVDTMIGGQGDDTFYIGGTTDTIVEYPGEGTDEVITFYTHALTPGSEIERLRTFDPKSTAAVNLTGNEFANQIFGNNGDNILDGRAGADLLQGNFGNDWYFVDNAGDIVVEAHESGFDRVFASVSYALPGGAGGFLERLSTTDNAGTAPINLTGNDIVNSIYGNAGPNILDGKGGADTLVGLGGDDWYFVDNAGDLVVEGTGQGVADRVFASVSYTLGAGVQVEKLTTTDNAGTGAINLTGNEFADTIFGNAGANTLDGKAGADAMFGLGGDDFYFVDNAGDAVIEAAGGGNDRVFASGAYALTAGQEIEKLTTDNNAGTANINLTGNELGNIIFGNAGSNVLKGGLGNDALVGLGGADAYVFDTALNAANNVDTLDDFSPTDDAIILSSGIFPTIAPGTLAASAFVVGTTALDADDRIVYDSTTGAIFYDPAGTAGGTAVHFATVAPGLALTHADFIVM